MKKERRDQIIRAMVKAGHTEEEIAEELDMSKSHIHRIKHELGLTVQRRCPKDDEKTIVEMFRQGHTRAEIANKLNWSIGTVTNILRENGFGKPVASGELEPVIVPERKTVKTEIIIAAGKKWRDITAYYLESEGIRWSM